MPEFSLCSIDSEIPNFSDAPQQLRLQLVLVMEWSARAPVRHDGAFGCNKIKFILVVTFAYCNFIWSETSFTSVTNFRLSANMRHVDLVDHLR
uniref:Uncharacterized protein n=1 Tax=Pararge aegeria TaxID=116150 RepID=S4PS84_9NEOP